MLYFKDNRFHIGGLSYALPEEVFIITDYERNLNNGFAFKDINENITVTVETSKGLCENYFSSEEFTENGFTVEKSAPFGYSDIMGVSAIYNSKYNIYYEIRLNLPMPTNKENILVILIEAKRGQASIEDIKTTRFIIDFLLSLKKDITAPILL